MKSQYNIGKLLKDKNALFNYIQDEFGAKMGVVVGLKGRDRATPLVGWALFSEFDDGRITMDKQSKPCREAFARVYEALDNFAKYCGNKMTAKRVEDVKEILDSQDDFTIIPKDIKYRAIELAILRANPDREQYFVCSNPIYNQQDTLIPQNPRTLYKTEGTHLVHGSSEFNYFDKYAISYIKKACRAMEFRCWRFYKPEITNKERNSK